MKKFNKVKLLLATIGITVCCAALCVVLLFYSAVLLEKGADIFLNSALEKSDMHIKVAAVETPGLQTLKLRGVQVWWHGQLLADDGYLNIKVDWLRSLKNRAVYLKELNCQIGAIDIAAYTSETPRLATAERDEREALCNFYENCQFLLTNIDRAEVAIGKIHLSAGVLCENVHFDKANTLNARCRGAIAHVEWNQQQLHALQLDLIQLPKAIQWQLRASGMASQRAFPPIEVRAEGEMNGESFSQWAAGALDPSTEVGWGQCHFQMPAERGLTSPITGEGNFSFGAFGLKWRDCAVQSAQYGEIATEGLYSFKDCAVVWGTLKCRGHSEVFEHMTLAANFSPLGGKIAAELKISPVGTIPLTVDFSRKEAAVQLMGTIAHSHFAAVIEGSRIDWKPFYLSSFPLTAQLTAGHFDYQTFSGAGRLDIGCDELAQWDEQLNCEQIGLGGKAALSLVLSSGKMGHKVRFAAQALSAREFACENLKWKARCQLQGEKINTTYWGKAAGLQGAWRQLGFYWRNCQWRGKIAGDYWELEHLSVEDRARGTFVGRGEGNIAAQGELEAHLTNFLLIDAPAADVKCSGSVRCAIEKGETQIKGELQVHDAHLQPDKLADVAVPVLALKRETAPEVTLSSALDISIEMPHRCFVKSPLLSSEWGGKIHLWGTTTHLQLAADFKSIHGKIQILQRELKLTTGIVECDDLTKGFFISLGGNMQKGGDAIDLNIAGKLLEPEINLISRSAKPLSEALAQIFFDRPMNELSAGQALQIVQLIDNVQQRGGAGWLAAQKLGLDQLSFTLPQQKGERGKMALSKQLTDRITVGLEQDLDQADSSLSLETTLTDQLSLEAEIHKSEDTALKLRWKKDY